MAPLNRYMQRVRELGLKGTANRVLNRASAWAEPQVWRLRARRGMSDTDLLARFSPSWGSTDEMLAHYAQRPAATWPLAHQDAAGNLGALRQCCPDAVAAIVTVADKALRHEFDLLGNDHTYGDAIGWNVDPISGTEWPLLHVRQIDDYLWSGDVTPDFLLTWELNRHQHFVALGLAYELTGNAHYVEELVAQMQSWMQDNPLRHGINWYSGLELALRVTSWALAFQCVRQALPFRDGVATEVLKSLYQQTDFLSSHLSISGVPNNHLIAEAMALVVVGGSFPEFKDAAEWVRTGLEIIEAEAASQTASDGVNKEAASGYHRFVAEALLLVLAMGRRKLVPASPTVERHLQAMLDHLYYLVAPDHHMPMWGDGGYVRAFRLSWGQSFWDPRWLLAVGASLFDQSSWKRVAGEPAIENFLLLGEDAAVRWEELAPQTPGPTSKGFKESGIYILRDSWDEKSDMLFFRCGPFGLGGEGYAAHAHCDMLAVLLWVHGRPLLVDSGTYHYHGTWRDPFRLTAYHNTLVADGHDQATPLNAFAWTGVPQAARIDWEPGRRVGGAMEIAPGIRHERSIIHALPGVWTLSDRVAARDGGQHTLVWHFHFAPDLTVRPASTGHAWLAEAEGKPYARIVPPDGVQLKLESGWFSDRYNTKVEKPVLVASYQGFVPAEGLTFGWNFQYESGESGS